MIYNFRNDNILNKDILMSWVATIIQKSGRSPQVPDKDSNPHTRITDILGKKLRKKNPWQIPSNYETGCHYPKGILKLDLDE